MERYFDFTCYYQAFVTSSGWSWECLEEWGQFLWLAVPGIITVAAEISNFETGAFVTGSIDGTQQAAYIIMFNIGVISYMVCSLSPWILFMAYQCCQVPLSISIAVGIRVGNMLGAGEPDKAKKAMMVAISFACQLNNSICLQNNFLPPYSVVVVHSSDNNVKLSSYWGAIY